MSMLSSIELSELRNRAIGQNEYVRYLDERTADARAKVSVSVRHALRPAQIVRQLRRLGYACTPQLGRTLIWDEPAPLTRTYATSWLTGLRGVLAVKVVTFHYVMAFCDFGFQPWGVDERHTHFFQLPIIRLLYAGFSSQIFFGISGFLVAMRVLQAQNRRSSVGAHQHQDIFASISIDLFRKVFRLYLPVFAITLCTAIYVWLGFYESYREPLLNHEKLFPGDWYEPRPKQMSLWSQLSYWGHEMFDLTNVVTENTVYPFHDQHLWAILAEMRGTVHLYGVLTALSQLSPESRLVAMGAVSILYFYWNHWEVWVFILGAMVVQIDLLLDRREPQHQFPRSKTDDDDTSFEPAPSLARPNRPTLKQRWSSHRLVVTAATASKDQRFKRVARYALFIAALYLLSYPVAAASAYAPGYLLLNHFIPRSMVRKDKFYPNIGTFLLLLCLARSDPATSRWRKVLSSQMAQYLGKINFAMFLVHGPIMHALGYMLPHKVAWTFGTELRYMEGLPWVCAVGFGWLITLAMCLWAADVWQREVECRCVEWQRKLERFCFVDGNGTGNVAQERGRD
ncbi:uncharacterized protein AB675_2133 [Cyphellophora attinorum]|uniref:Acyltransferase 3 domain-containing protein n=1 Tax=Cyphellophora attinorum TaxID=1664694 RepID=A0A0N1HD19_9EURO|nr:uncharacterized protein AB675_2133 [Phialophora attinorum]KPI42776.1 hypothetical protein AB675_2133 [Phialophora attinorum]